MSTVLKFDKLTRLGDDPCGISDRDLQNQKIGSYLTQNHFEKWCGMETPIDFATSQPNVFYSGSNQLGINGCNVNTNSELKLTNLTRSKCKINLLERPFLTVPYLGRGSCNVDLESQIQHGDMLINKKSVNTTSETSHINYRHYPLIPSIESTVTNPENLVEDSAADGWIRGGVPSREIARTNTYQN